MKLTDTGLRFILLCAVAFAAANAIGLTTDQILQNVYDASNTALRANIVAGGGGGGFVTGSGTTNGAAMWTASTTLGDAPPTDFLTEAQITNLPTDLANLAQNSGGSGSGTGATGSSLLSGCGFFNTTGLTFAVSSCTYFIGGTSYTSPATTVTLSAADPSNPRIDDLIVNTTPVALKVDGTAAANPSEPAVDPSTQLKLAAVLINASGTTPANLSNENVYLDNAQWTCTAGTGWNCDDTGNPHSGTKDIKGTAVTANNYTRLVRSSTININQFQQLGLWIAPVTWNNGRSLVLTLRDANQVQIGNAITITNGSYGFSRTNTAYQLIAIPVSQFGVPTSTVIKELRLNPQGSGGTFTFYVDDIIFQTSTNAVTFPNPQYDARYLPQGSSNTLQKKDSTTGQLAASSVSDNGTTVSTSEALSVGALTYNGKLNIADINSDSSSFTVAHRIHYVTTSTSTIVATMPASPTVGDTYTVIKADSGNGNITWTRAGSQTLNGATTRAVSAQYGVDTCVYVASNAWVCQGSGV